MYEYCIVCKKKKDHFGWKNQGDGWICGDHFKVSYPEFVPQSTKEDRHTHAKSMIQPFREGKLSKEYVDTYGTKNINVTKDEVRKAKPVWGDVLKSGWERSR